MHRDDLGDQPYHALLIENTPYVRETVPPIASAINEALINFMAEIISETAVKHFARLFLQEPLAAIMKQRDIYTRHFQKRISA